MNSIVVLSLALALLSATTLADDGNKGLGLRAAVKEERRRIAESKCFAECADVMLRAGRGAKPERKKTADGRNKKPVVKFDKLVEDFETRVVIGGHRKKDCVDDCKDDYCGSSLSSDDASDCSDDCHDCCSDGDDCISSDFDKYNNDDDDDDDGGDDDDSKKNKSSSSKSSKSDDDYYSSKSSKSDDDVSASKASKSAEVSVALGGGSSSKTAKSYYYSTKSGKSSNKSSTKSSKSYYYSTKTSKSSDGARNLASHETCFADCMAASLSS